MNTANLQLEGLYLAIAALAGALVSKGVLTNQEVDTAFAEAEQTALADDRVADDLSPSHRSAVAFPARFLRMANNGAVGSETQPFSELAKMVGELEHRASASDQSDSEGRVFHKSPNGDIWLLVTDTGRRFVRHVPNPASGGSVELTDLQSFLDREPHSPQNQALTQLLN